MGFYFEDFEVWPTHDERLLTVALVGWQSQILVSNSTPLLAQILLALRGKSIQPSKEGV